MKYYVETHFFDHDGIVTSGGKGRDDYFEMLRKCGLKRIAIPVIKTCTDITAKERINIEIKLTALWRRRLRILKDGDVLFIHHPPSEKFLLFERIINEVKERGCTVVTIVFDLEAYLKPYYGRRELLKYTSSRLLEKAVLRISDYIIVHNDAMKNELKSMGIEPHRMFSVGVMDYLSDKAIDMDEIRFRTGKDLPVIFCGNLIKEKASFLDKIPSTLNINLYGPGYTGKDRTGINYKGVFPSHLIQDILEGSFGLVWDGESVERGKGVIGEYLRINNPHKMALYLSSGIPVIVWKESAMASFVRDEGCGLVVNNLREIPPLMDGLTDEDYKRMRLVACRVGNEMRQGIHIRFAVESVLNAIDRKIISNKKALIVFTREPEPGVSKTRMMSYLSAEQCTEFQKCMLKDIAGTVAKVHKNGTDIIVAYSGGIRFLKETFEDIACEYLEQRGENLGAKMENAISDAMSMGYERVVLIGSDIPDLEVESIEKAFDLLDEHDIVIGPTKDGGYYLIGMDEVHHEAFTVEHYGTDSVYEETLRVLGEAGLNIGEADEYQDIDTPDDAADYRVYMRDDKELRQSYTGRFLAKHAKISIIIPVYNEEAEIDRMMIQLNKYTDECEIIFVDGNSNDETPEKIEKFMSERQSGASCFKLITSDKGRGLQMNRGAEASSGDILFFLHCDSTVPEDFPSEIRRVMAAHKWGCFGVKFPSRNIFMLTNRIMSNHRARIRGLPFGDQGVFIDRELFYEMGMYPEQILMEDYDFSLALRKKGYRPGMTRKKILTSDRRYGKGTKSILKTEFNMWILRRMHRRCVSDEMLKNKYEDIRVK